MAKLTVEECLTINVSELKKWGYLNGYKYGGIQWRNRLGRIYAEIKLQSNFDNRLLIAKYYTQNKTGENKEYVNFIEISKTSCNYGGYRYWIHCSYCNKRKGALHLYGNYKFACRDCLNLSYASQQKYGIERSLGKVISYPDLSELSKGMRTSYKGKETKRFKKYKKYQKRLHSVLLVLSGLVGKS